MEHKGLEPDFEEITNSDKPSTPPDTKVTQTPANKNFTKHKEAEKYQFPGQFHDLEKHIIDMLRAQYEHNEIPGELIKLVKVWSKIPENVTQGISTMISCYL